VLRHARARARAIAHCSIALSQLKATRGGLDGAVCSCTAHTIGEHVFQPRRGGTIVMRPTAHSARVMLHAAKLEWDQLDDVQKTAIRSMRILLGAMCAELVGLRVPPHQHDWIVLGELAATTLNEVGKQGLTAFKELETHAERDEYLQSNTFSLEHLYNQLMSMHQKDCIGRARHDASNERAASEQAQQVKDRMGAPTASAAAVGGAAAAATLAPSPLPSPAVHDASAPALPTQRSLPAWDARAMAASDARAAQQPSMSVPVRAQVAQQPAGTMRRVLVPTCATSSRLLPTQAAQHAQHAQVGPARPESAQPTPQGGPPQGGSALPPPLEAAPSHEQSAQALMPTVLSRAGSASCPIDLSPPTTPKAPTLKPPTAPSTLPLPDGSADSTAAAAPSEDDAVAAAPPPQTCAPSLPCAVPIATPPPQTMAPKPSTVLPPESVTTLPIGLPAQAIGLPAQTVGLARHLASTIRPSSARAEQFGARFHTTARAMAVNIAIAINAPQAEVVHRCIAAVGAMMCGLVASEDEARHLYGVPTANWHASYFLYYKTMMATTFARRSISYMPALESLHLESMRQELERMQQQLSLPPPPLHSLRTPPQPPPQGCMAPLPEMAGPLCDLPPSPPDGQ
jgi:hypothetical protein